jgi:hypothetical protein
MPPETRRRHRRASGIQLAQDNVWLVCDHWHDHVCGAPQVPALLGTPCPWCGTPLRAHLYHDPKGGYRTPAPDERWPRR